MRHRPPSVRHRTGATVGVNRVWSYRTRVGPDRCLRRQPERQIISPTDPVTERLSRQLLRLPFFNTLAAAEQDDVVRAVHDFYGGAGA